MDRQDWSYLICSYLSGITSMTITAVGGAMSVWIASGAVTGRARTILLVMLGCWYAVALALGINCRARIFRYLSLAIWAVVILLTVWAALPTTGLTER